MSKIKAFPFAGKIFTKQIEESDGLCTFVHKKGLSFSLGISEEDGSVFSFLGKSTAGEDFDFMTKKDYVTFESKREKENDSAS